MMQSVVKGAVNLTNIFLYRRKAQALLAGVNRPKKNMDTVSREFEYPSDVAGCHRMLNRFS